jgi:dimethylargininase
MNKPFQFQAITRQVSRSIQDCELTHLDRQPINLERARKQHKDYEEALRRLGCRVLQLPEEPDLPDSVFVEDIALVFPDVAVLTYPGVDSRLPERESIRTNLQPFRRVLEIKPPARLDGGDVLVLGREIFIGLSTRSNAEAVNALSGILKNFGYHIHGVSLKDCLHLKSAVTRVGENTLLLNPDWVNQDIFTGWDLVEVAPGEDYAANALLIGKRVLYAAVYRETAKRLIDAGISLEIVDVSELAKAEGAVTCCSLVFEIL